MCWESQALVFPPTAEATQTLLFAWTNLRSEVQGNLAPLCRGAGKARSTQGVQAQAPKYGPNGRQGHGRPGDYDRGGLVRFAGMSAALDTGPGQGALGAVGEDDLLRALGCCNATFWRAVWLASLPPHSPFGGFFLRLRLGAVWGFVTQ